MADAAAIVRWFEYELETLIPELERIETAPTGLPKNIEDLTGSLRDEIRRAEDLVGTHTKRKILRDAATFKRPIYEFRLWRTNKQLHSIRREITGRRNELLSDRAVFPLLDFAAKEQTVPSYLRRCMHYLLLFPTDYQVPARRLIALWVSEGLIHSSRHDDESVEQIAERCLNELIDLKVLLATTRKRNGKVKACRIDAVRRTKLLEEADKAHFLRDGNDKIRRLVDCNNSAGADSFIQIHGNPEISQLVPNYRVVISFLSFNTQEGIKPGEDIGDFIRKCISARCFIWLRVLDLEGVFRPKLPGTLGRLIALKYLGLRWTYLEKLPGSVDQLFNLQVLDVKHTYISVLPRSIWRMQYLRHLYLSEVYRTRFPRPPSQVTLTALQTLWGAFVDEDTPVQGGLDRLFNIRKLGLSCRSRESKQAEIARQLDAIDKWILSLEFLESLRLKSRDENNEAVDLRLTSLKGNRNLSTLYLLGKLNSFILCELPASLTNITLSGSEFDLDPFEFLGMLPNLVALQLLGKSMVQHQKLYCSIRGFPQLKVLRIWMMECLKDLEAEEGSLPCLEELEIRSCHNLEKLPDRLRQIKNLEVRLTSMRQEFVQIAGRKYARVEHVPKDDQFILTNTPRFVIETEDLASACFVGYQHSSSSNSTLGSIF